MLEYVLSIFGVLQNVQSRREDRYLKASTILDEISSNIALANQTISFEMLRLGLLCDEKHIPKDSALKLLSEMVPQCLTILDQVHQNRANLKKHGASLEVITLLETWKSTSTQIGPYAKNVAATIEAVINRS